MRERLQIDNRPISEAKFAKCFWEVWDRLESSQATAERNNSRNARDKPLYFHYLTLMAFHFYMKEGVGTAVIECGVGGEYDTTNIMVTPSATGVTSLGIDHEAMLGNTIDSIAWHKGGIFKEGVPAFTVPQPDEAMTVLQDRARERGTQLLVVPRHSEIDNIMLGLQGEFQMLNASLAVAISALHLNRLGYSRIPDPLNPNAQLPAEFIKALETTRLGGRCEMRRDIMLERLTWYIDGGHTLESIDVAGRWFANQTATSKKHGAQRILIFNQQKRDASSLAKRLHETLSSALNDARPFEHVIFCPNITYKDSGYASDLISINTNKDDVASLRVQQELAATWESIDSKAQVHVLGTIEEAVARARDVAGENKAEILVTGSLHLVGGLIEVLESELTRTET